MLNASVGVQRVIGRLRRPRSLGPDTASTLQTRSVSAARQVRGGLRSIAVASPISPPPVIAAGHRTRRRRAAAAGSTARLGHDRIVGRRGRDDRARRLRGAASRPAARPTADPSAAPPATAARPASPRPRSAASPAAAPSTATTTRATAPGDGATSTPQGDQTGGDSGNVVADANSPPSQGPFLEDGTLLKPVAVDTTIEDGSDLLRTYKVKSGDTLTGIASQVRRLDDDRSGGRTTSSPRTTSTSARCSSIPPVTGLVVTVTAERHARRARREVQGRASATSSTTNELDGPEPRRRPGRSSCPGAKGKPIPTPKPRQGHDHASRSSSRRRRRRRYRPAAHDLQRRPASPGRSSAAATTSASTSTTATTALDIAADYGSHGRRRRRPAR